MLDPVHVNGQSVEVRLDADRGGISQSLASEVMGIVVRAVVDSLHLAVGEVVKAVVMNLARTGAEISVEISVIRQEARVVKKIALLEITARKFNEAIIAMDGDRLWDPRVRTIYCDSLFENLRVELRRAGSC